MKNISVCSWSYRLSAARVAEEMSKSGVTHVHLALNPFVDPLAVVPGTAGETENVAGTGGVDPLEKQRADIEEYLASGRWVISSTLHNSRYDDYSTLESALDKIGFTGYLAVEREAGNDRPGDIAAAVEDLKRR